VHHHNLFFFFSSRRRHTRCLSDWSSDVCSSDLAAFRSPQRFVALGSAAPIHGTDYSNYTRLTWCVDGKAKGIDVNWFAEQNYPRSEERRVGKEGRYWLWQFAYSINENRRK